MRVKAQGRCPNCGAVVQSFEFYNWDTYALPCGCEFKPEDHAGDGDMPF